MKLRYYQQQINQQAENFLFNSPEQRAQVYAPTGAGKTVCFIKLIESAIKFGACNIAVLHPRLALSQDQLMRFKKVLGETVHYTSFHSGAHYGGNVEIAEFATTNEEKLFKIINQTNRPHITFTTYDSYDKLLNMEFDLIICDEAHYLVNAKFNKYVEQMNATKILFFTATPIREDMEDSGMMDLDLFGKIIAQVTPHELIQGGYIVAPMVHTLECTTDKRADKADISDIIVNAYVNQWKDVSANGMNIHQMLVACRDVQVDILETIDKHIREIRDGITEQSNGMIDGSSIDIYTVTANVTTKNGTPYSKGRAEAIKEIKEAGRNVILAHYDTLSEGIDVDTLGGVVIMREMTKSKLIQTIGRASRPFVGDLDHEFNPRPELFNVKTGFDIRKKQRSIITFPVVDGSWVAGKSGEEVAEAFIAGGYGDLLDYMPKADFKPTGKDRVGEDIDEPTFLSDVLSVSVQKRLVELEKFFDFE